MRGARGEGQMLCLYLPISWRPGSVVQLARGLVANLSDRFRGRSEGAGHLPCPSPLSGENLASGSRAPTSQEAFRHEKLSIHIAGIWG